MTKSEIANKATDYMAVGYLASWLALVNELILHGPWVQYTAFIVFCWTVARVLWWCARKVYLWRKGRSFITISRDGDQ
jgi:hypothetical protein